MTTICLSMIVKNEAHVIRRGLDTVKPFIDHWIISDTGSTDGTQKVIREHMKDIPGELIERPWVDFAHNRNEPLRIAKEKADYVLFLDADEELVVPPGWKMPELTDDAYKIVVHHPPDIRYDRVSLVASRLPFRYVGVLHEHVMCDAPANYVEIPEVFIRENPEGARSRDKRKWEKDAEVLEAGLRAEPNNSRYVLYLAQTYCGGGLWQKALKLYQQRTKMGGWDEEVWYSHYQFARLSELAGHVEGEVINLFLRAHENRPSRAEAIYQLGVYCRVRYLPHLHYVFARAAAAIPRTKDRLFVASSVYAWRAVDEWAIAAHNTKRFEEGRSLCERLLQNPEVPQNDRGRILGNLNLCLKALGLPKVERYPAPGTAEVVA